MADERKTKLNAINLIQLTAEGKLETVAGESDPQDLLDDKASLSDDGALMLPNTLIYGVDQPRNRKWSSNHGWINVTAPDDGIDLVKVETGEVTDTTHRQVFGGVVEIVYSERRSNGTWRAFYEELIFALTFRSSGNAQFDFSSKGRVEATSSTSTSFKLLLKDSAPTSAILRLAVATSDSATHNVLNCELRAWSASIDNARIITIEGA